MPINAINPSFGQKFYIPGSGSRNANRFAGTNRTNDLFGDVKKIITGKGVTTTFYTGDEKNLIVLENPPQSLLNELFNAKIEFFNEGAFKIFKNM